MPTNRLSDAAVRNAKPKTSAYKLSDGGGLHLLVSPAGGRLWRLAYRYNGKQKTLALGAYPTVGLADARAGREAAKKLLHDGKDPAVVKKVSGGGPAGDHRPTFGSVAKAWFDARSKRWVGL